MLAIDSTLLQDAYDVIIVGSGYGGAISAARLGFANRAAGGGLRIALLERGAEHPTGSFPEHELELIEKVRHPQLNPLGLYEYRSFVGIDVVQGCGLGGTSLINANVAIQPDAETFDDGWPEELRAEAADGRLQKYYDRAGAMLGVGPYAEDQGLRKVPVLREVATAVGARCDVLNIAVSKKDRVTRYGVGRRACTNCGDCVTGCNVGAKNTLTTNFLPLAQACGVKIFTGVEVLRVGRGEPRLFSLTCLERAQPHGRQWQERQISAHTVVLSAGSLGTTGILLRSRDAGLSLSPSLGERFSGNGDFISFAYNSNRITDVLGFGLDTGPRSHVKAGPTITAGVRVGAGEGQMDRRFLVEDVSCPRPLADVLRRGFFALSPASDLSVLAGPDRAARWARDVVYNSSGAANSTLGFLIMGHDAADGRVRLTQHGEPYVDWQRAPEDDIYRRINEVLRAGAEHIGGTYLENPRWHPRLGRRLITVHPLGGCATADHAGGGVVDHLGRVFTEDGQTHPGLYVADGSVIPRSLGVNPFMTISAFAERMADQLREDLDLPSFDREREWDDVADPPPPAQPRRQRRA